MKQWPNILSVESVVNGAAQAKLPDGRWVPARGLGYASLFQRFKAAWLVFTGRADALTWPGQ